MNAYEQLLEYVNTLQIVDTHEHLSEEKEWVAQDRDVLAEWLLHYFSCDLVSAGLSPRALAGEIYDNSRPVTEKWKLLEPFWDAARHTGYGRSLDIAARDIYGVPRVDGSTIDELNRRFVAARQAAAKGKSHYHFVLKEKSRIAVSLRDALKGPVLNSDRTYFRDVFRIDRFLGPSDPVELRNISSETGIPIHNLADYRDAIEAALDNALRQGAVALKSAAAYERPLKYDKVTTAVAEERFNRLLGRPLGDDVGPVSLAENKPLEDYVFHWFMTLADRRGLTVQIHTGIQEGNGNELANSHPILLSNVFLEYSNVTFDLFHIGYPFDRVVSTLAKNFRNVMIDMCWAHIISPEASVRALVEFLDAVPANKISAFGGDYLFVDGVYGHQYIARRNVARALAIKVADGCFDLDRAKEIARWLFIDNPVRIFKLEP